MTNPIGPLGAGAAASLPSAVLDQAAQILRKAATADVPNLRRVADDVVDVADTQPEHAADLLEAMKPQLSTADRERLGHDVAQSAGAKAEQQQSGMARAASLALDMTQLALGIAGIFDPTPTCDAIDGVISLLRGDYFGGAISAVSMIPYAGDVAKLGKLHKLVSVATEAADMAKALPNFAATIAPDVARARQALQAVDVRTLSRQQAEGLSALRQQLDRIGDAPTPSLRDLLRDVRAERQAANGSTRAVTRIDDLLPGTQTREITAELRDLENLLQEGKANQRVDAHIDRLAHARTEVSPRLHNPLPADFADIATASSEKLVFRNADHLLSHFGLQRIADHPEHRALWQAAHDAVTGPDQGNAYTRALATLAAGEELTGKDARAAFGHVRARFAELFEARYGHRPADVEHMINLSICPSLALHPHNLVVTRREHELGTKQHELLHWIKSGGDSVNDARAWWMQIYAGETERFRDMTPQQVQQAVQELLARYGMTEPS